MRQCSLEAERKSAEERRAGTPTYVRHGQGYPNLVMEDNSTILPH